MLILLGDNSIQDGVSVTTQEGRRPTSLQGDGALF